MVQLDKQYMQPIRAEAVCCESVVHIGLDQRAWNILKQSIKLATHLLASCSVAGCKQSSACILPPSKVTQHPLEGVLRNFTCRQP